MGGGLLIRLRIVAETFPVLEVLLLPPLFLFDTIVMFYIVYCRAPDIWRKVSLILKGMTATRQEDGVWCVCVD